MYTISKWGVTGFAKSLSSKYNLTPIKITSIYPGPFTTNIDKNAGDDFGDNHSAEMTVSEVAHSVIEAINVSDKLQIDTIELKNTNWNQ